MRIYLVITRKAVANYDADCGPRRFHKFAMQYTSCRLRDIVRLSVYQQNLFQLSAKLIRQSQVSSGAAQDRPGFRVEGRGQLTVA